MVIVDLVTMRSEGKKDRASPHIFRNTLQIQYFSLLLRIKPEGWKDRMYKRLKVAFWGAAFIRAL